MATEDKGLSVEAAHAEGKHATVFRKNSAFAAAWIAGMYHLHWRDGVKQRFNPALASQTVRGDAMHFGFQQSIGDAGAMNSDEGLSRVDRLREQRRRITERIGHFESGSDSWEKPRLSTGAVSESLVLRAMVRVNPERCPDTETASRGVDTLAAKRELDRAGALKLLAGSKEIALAIVDIRAEDARERADGLEETTDDIMGEMF